jgi:NAD(P)-dependent dehydrogenase (short-subunit alcohol dehydrogenase family)
MDKEFANKVLLITGATSGIGKATAIRFAEEGASIAAIGRNETALKDLAEQIHGIGAQCVTINADLSHEEGAGNIVNVSSVTGLRAFPGVLAYCVSKAGLDQLTRCAALELAAKGVRVNAVNPGVVVTEIHKRGGMNEEQYEAFLEHSKGTHPLGRVGEAREIAELIFFLASDRASWITGATYSIDGGRAQTCAR